MADVLTQEQRRLNMSRIRGKNTNPELLIRRALHARGFRFRLHPADLPGKPDLVLPKYRTAIFIHGCFWHCHDCHLFKLPAIRTEFWEKKIKGNQERDKFNLDKLIDENWRVITIWECALKGRTKPTPDELLYQLEALIRQPDQPAHELRGGNQ